MQIFSADKQPDDLNCVTDQLGNVWSYNPKELDRLGGNECLS